MVCFEPPANENSIKVEFLIFYINVTEVQLFCTGRLQSNTAVSENLFLVEFSIQPTWFLILFYLKSTPSEEKAVWKIDNEKEIISL